MGFTEYSGYLGKLREWMRLKPLHAHENHTYRIGQLYPELAKVGKDIIEGEATLGCEDALAGITA